MSKLIDLEFAINECKKPSIYDLCDTYYFLKELPTIDPVHFAGGCYCKECLHSEPIEYKFADDWVVPIDEYWCNEHKITMPLKGFCSEGRKDDTKNV